jgi:hypothetical protein
MAGRLLVVVPPQTGCAIAEVVLTRRRFHQLLDQTAQHLNLRVLGKSLRAHHIHDGKSKPTPPQKIWNVASQPTVHYRTQPERMRHNAGI